MNEVRIFRVGPVDAAGACLYVPVSSERPLEVEDARDDVEGIRKIVAQWPEATYVCSPDLVDAASRLGVATAPLEGITQVTRISTAMSIAQDPDFDAVSKPSSVQVLMRGVGQFIHRDVAQRWPYRLSIDIELRGDRQAMFFGVVLIAPFPGLVLFDDASHAKKCALLDRAEQNTFISQHDNLLVTLETPPEYASIWIRDFYDIDMMPRMTKRQSDKVLADDEDALVMGGVFSALALVEDIRETVYSTTQTPNREVRTFTSPGSPWPFIHPLGA